MKLIGESLCLDCEGTGYVGYINKPPEFDQFRFLSSIREIFDRPMNVTKYKAIQIISESNHKVVKVFKSFILRSLTSTICLRCNGKKIELKLYQT